mgnify:CR=1 FL=1
MRRLLATLVALLCAVVLPGIAQAGPDVNIQEAELARSPNAPVPIAPRGPGGPIYNTIPDPFPGSFPSMGYEANSLDEFGDHIVLGSTARDLEKIELTMTNWACENDYTWNGSSWVANRDGTAGEACVTTPDSGFDHPITLNIYDVDYSGGPPALGTLLASKTDTYFMYYRPSWDSVNCTGAGETPADDIPFGGKWYDPVLGACVHGYNTTIEYDFTSDGITLPDEIIVTVAYNTANHGAVPIGSAGPYSSLNVAVDPPPPTIGSNPEPDDTWGDSSWAGYYCDGGAGGTDTLRRDYAVDCWIGYTPIMVINPTPPPQLPATGTIAVVILGVLLLGTLAFSVRGLTKNR